MARLVPFACLIGALVAVAAASAATRQHAPAIATNPPLAISHDPYFLDRVADRIIEVDVSVRATDGGYSAWLERKSAATAC